VSHAIDIKSQSHIRLANPSSTLIGVPEILATKKPSSDKYVNAFIQ
jgi:hypothetical protein